jgi:lysozyme
MKRVCKVASGWVYETIKNFEGLRLGAYRCPAGKLTIGYGHTGSDVVEGMVISRTEADALLVRDVMGFASKVNEMLVWDVTDGQFDAMVDFAFNLGATALKGSTLLRKLEAGDVDGAAEEFLRWNKSRVNGEVVVLPGLTKRRAAERVRFLS